MHSLTPEINDEDEDPYAVESLVVHGALDAGLLSYSIVSVLFVPFITLLDFAL